MIELIEKIVGRDNRSKIEMLSSTIDEKEESLKRLERACSQKKHQLDRLVDESIVCRHQLLQKSNFLRKKSDELYRVQEKLKNIKDRIVLVEEVEANNKTLVGKVSKLEKLINNEESVDENRSSASEIQKLKEIIEDRERSIKRLKEADAMEAIQEQKDVLQISKDQFSEIEKRLKEYMQRVAFLEGENVKLVAETQTKKEFNLLEKVNSSLFNLKDVTFPDFFKESHEKLSKA